MFGLFCQTTICRVDNGSSSQKSLNRAKIKQKSQIGYMAAFVTRNLTKHLWRYTSSSMLKWRIFTVKTKKIPTCMLKCMICSWVQSYKQFKSHIISLIYASEKYYSEKLLFNVCTCSLMVVKGTVKVQTADIPVSFFFFFFLEDYTNKNTIFLCWCSYTHIAQCKK